jgi:hypothetical protein
LRPNNGPASTWKDDPTTAKEEDRKAPPIPNNISVNGGNTPFAMPGIVESTNVYASTASTLRVVQPRQFPSHDEASRDGSESAGRRYMFHVDNHQKKISKKCGDTRTIKFNPLPLSEAFKSVPSNDEDDDDDKTASMDTVDKQHPKGDFWGWEMRK